MGYTTKDIAVIFEPKGVSLAALPNFVQFESEPALKQYLEANITVLAEDVTWQLDTYYNSGGARLPIFGTQWRTANRIYISEYAGQNFRYVGKSNDGAWCHVCNSAGALILSFQTGSDNEYSGTFPAASSYILLTNNAEFTLNPTLTVNGVNVLVRDWAAYSRLTITEATGMAHLFSGTSNRSDVGGSVYYIAASRADTAENLRQALLSDKWVAANFEVRIPSIWSNDTVSNGETVNIRSKGAGDEYNIDITGLASAYNIEWINEVSQNNDSISGEASSVEISLDVYVDPPVFLGATDRPTTSELLGTFALSLSKTYTGEPVWFDINAPFARSGRYNIPSSSPGWFDTGTIRAARFVARVAGVDNFAFYISNALYMVNGYSYHSDPVDIEDYVYDNRKIKLLTNKPRTTYMRGQREYLNFILSDMNRGVTGAPDWAVYILYRAYDSVGNYLGNWQSDAVNRTTLSMVNTCSLRIDEVLDNYPLAGLIKVSLAREGAIISSDLEYTIRPQELHTLNQFTFLNKLGGWDSFNFDAPTMEDTRVAFDTFTRTVTPEHTKSEGVESAYAARLDVPLSVTGAPVTDEVAEWLKELAASLVVLDSAGNYIIKTEFTLPTSEGAKNMQVPAMRYKLSETYTNE